MRVRIVFLPDYSLVLSLLKHKSLGQFLKNSSSSSNSVRARACVYIYIYKEREREREREREMSSSYIWYLSKELYIF